MQIRNEAQLSAISSLLLKNCASVDSQLAISAVTAFLSVSAAMR